MGPDTMEDTGDILLQRAGEADRWIRAVDVLPGTAAVVRDVTVYTKSSTGEKTIAWWFPGDDPKSAPTDAGFHWPANSELRARIHYRKTWTYDGKVVTDRTSVGVYLLSHAPQHEMRNWSSWPDPPVLDRDVQVVAVRVDGGASDETVKVTAIRPNGSSLDLIHLLPRPDWNRWYWLPNPIPLPKGSRVDTIGGSDVHAWLDVVDAGK
jgi:hypothetical protein